MAMPTQEAPQELQQVSEVGQMARMNTGTSMH